MSNGTSIGDNSGTQNHMLFTSRRNNIFSEAGAFGCSFLSSNGTGVGDNTEYSQTLAPSFAKEGAGVDDDSVRSKLHAFY
jgi:hypothetical protein